MKHPESSISMRRWSTLAHRDVLVPALDKIFFEASNTKSFASADIRAQFRTRWLGRYLSDFPQLAHLLFVPADVEPENLGGYVIGEHSDPAATDRYNDIGYFHLLADVSPRYPAHLHINLRADLRGKGLGSRLIESFIADAAAAGCPGVHIVTGANLRNVGFYLQNGFGEVKRFDWKGNVLVMLGRLIG